MARGFDLSAVGKVARKLGRGGPPQSNIDLAPELTIIILELDGFMPRAEYGPGFCVSASAILVVVGLYDFHGTSHRRAISMKPYATHVVPVIVLLVFLYFVFDPATYKGITETGYLKRLGLDLPVGLYRIVSAVGLVIAVVVLWKSC
jgi:hypothetical protein